MAFGEHLSARLGALVQRFQLPTAAADLLAVLVRLDLDPTFANDVRGRDAHQRSGIAPWDLLLAEWENSNRSSEELQEGVTVLEGWGLLQVVGRNPADPITPGSTPLRLTAAGRGCAGLGPTPLKPLPDSGPIPWEIVHGASRERLLLWCLDTIGDTARDTVQARGTDVKADFLAGQVALRMVSHGAAVVDGFGVEEPVLWERLMAPTAKAAARRLLLLPEPSSARFAALLSGATLRWVEPHVVARRERVVLDQGISDRLKAPSPADLMGVPDSELAAPRRYTVAWEDLILPKKLQWQIRQAMVHCRHRLASGNGYRLLVSGLPGTGKSMSAEALATFLDRPLVKLDLSTVLSKWLGETEKLLAQVFDVAEASGSVLVLDEAEALLRQRESDKGGGLGALATGVAYLLTRLERFKGALVATTNRTRDLDEAFFRRFDDFLIFPIPDAPTRIQLWEKYLPKVHQVDMTLISGSFAISGGLIKGAAIRSAAWAEGLERPLDTAVLLASLARELEKNDRNPSEALVDPYRDDVIRLLEGPV